MPRVSVPFLAPATLCLCLSLVAAACSGDDDAGPAQLPAGISQQEAVVDGLAIRYLVGGEGPPMLLLNGWPQSKYQWRRVIPRLLEHATIVAPDLPGTGESDIPDDGYDKRTTARRLHALVQQLGLDRVTVVGHDIGAMVGLAYAAEFPDEVATLVFMEAPAPADAFYQIPSLLPDGSGIWWFGLHSVPDLPEDLIVGREKAYYSWFLHTLAARKDAFGEADIAEYVRTGSGRARVSAGMAYYRAFAQDIEDNRALADAPLALPVVAIGAEFGVGEGVAQSLQPFAADITPVVIAGSGHWIPEEDPAALADRLLEALP